MNLRAVLIFILGEFFSPEEKENSHKASNA
jgi:hypothetical protein